jgi:hypothetical protein
MFKIIKNVGKTDTGAVLFLFEDKAGKTFILAMERANGSLVFKYYTLEELAAATYANGVYSNVGMFKNTLTLDKSVVDALTGTGHPDGNELQYHAGLVSAYFPEITNLNYMPIPAALGTITVSTINSSVVTPPKTGKTLKTAKIAANPDGTVTVSEIVKGDMISIDGGTAVTATEDVYTSEKLKDGEHTVLIGEVATGTHYYDGLAKKVTTKIELLSAPLDWVQENPKTSIGIGIGLLLLIKFVLIPLYNGEPVLGMGDNKPKKSVSSKRRFIDV